MVHPFSRCLSSQPNHGFQRHSSGMQAQLPQLQCTSLWIIQPLQPREAVAISMWSRSHEKSWLSHGLVENWTGASHIQPHLLRILAGADRFETGWTQKHVIWAEQQKIHRCLQASRLAVALMSVCSRNIRSSCCLGALQFDNVSSLPATSCGSDRHCTWALCSDSCAGASSKSLPWLIWRKRD